MILAGFWMISMDFRGFSHGFGRKIKENQGKSIKINMRSTFFLLKPVLSPCKRDLNMF